jgi:hypothetical protein
MKGKLSCDFRVSRLEFGFLIADFVAKLLQLLATGIRA